MQVPTKFPQKSRKLGPITEKFLQIGANSGKIPASWVKLPHSLPLPPLFSGDLGTTSRFLQVLRRSPIVVCVLIGSSDTIASRRHTIRGFCFTSSGWWVGGGSQNCWC